MDTNQRPWEVFENRCDACGAESFYRAQRVAFDLDFHSHTIEVEPNVRVPTLYFCGHHGYKNREALEHQGFIVEDWTHQINTAPSVSANAIDK